MCQNNEYFATIGIIAIIVFAIIMIFPYIGTGGSALIFLVMLVSGNYFWRIFGLGDEWMQFILINILFIYLIFYLLYYKLKKEEEWLIQGLSYILPIIMFGYRFSTPEVINSLIDLGAISWVLAIPILGAIFSIIIFVITLVQGDHEALVTFGQEGFLAGLILVIFVYATIYIIATKRHWKIISLIQMGSLMFPLTLLIIWLSDVSSVVMLSVTLGPIVVITLLILKFDPLDPLITYIKDVVQKRFPKAPKEVKEPKSKKKRKLFHGPKVSEAYVKFKSYVKIYASKYKYLILLVIDLMLYLIVSEGLDLWVSISDITKAIRYYPEMLPLMIALILIWVVIAYAVLLIIHHVIVNVVKDYFKD